MQQISPTPCKLLTSCHLILNSSLLNFPCPLCVRKTALNDFFPTHSTHIKIHIMLPSLNHFNFFSFANWKFESQQQQTVGFRSERANPLPAGIFLPLKHIKCFQIFQVKALNSCIDLVLLNIAYNFISNLGFTLKPKDCPLLV